MSNEYSQGDHRDSGRYGPQRGGRGGQGGGYGGQGGGHGGGGNRERRGVPLSDLDPTTTEASRKVIGAAIEVHRALGPGYGREVYANALKFELKTLGVTFEEQHAIPVKYKDQTIGHVNADLWVEGRFIVAVSASPGQVSTSERLSLRAQLKAADFELGLIINFGERRLKDGLVRVVNIDKIRTEKGLPDDFEDEAGGHEFDQ
ncbi:MAG: GxxExxY protein [Phycisphaerales bacterium]|jgi:GxxExxY protein